MCKADPFRYKMTKSLLSEVQMQQIETVVKMDTICGQGEMVHLSNDQDRIQVQGKLGKKYKFSEFFGNSEIRSEIPSEIRSKYSQGDILSSERSPRGNAFSGHPECHGYNSVWLVSRGHRAIIERFQVITRRQAEQARARQLQTQSQLETDISTVNEIRRPSWMRGPIQDNKDWKVICVAANNSFFHVFPFLKIGPFKSHWFHLQQPKSSIYNTVGRVSMDFAETFDPRF